MDSVQAIRKWTKEGSSPIEDIIEAREAIKKASLEMAKVKTKKAKEEETVTVNKTKKELEQEYYVENHIKTNNGTLLRYVGQPDGLQRLFNNTLDEAWMKVPHGETKVVTTKEVPKTEETVV